MSPFWRAILWCNDLWHEGRAHFHGLKENRAPACFQHPKSSLSMKFRAWECLLFKRACTRVLYRLFVWGDEEDGCTQARMAIAWQWIQTASIHRAVLQHPGTVHRPMVSHKDVNKLPPVVSDGLLLDGVKQLPFQKTLCGSCWWFKMDVIAVYCTNCWAESWWPSQLGKTFSYHYQVISGWESNSTMT